MKFLPTALALTGTVLVAPVLAGYATGTAAPAPLARSFGAAAITTLAANGIEQAAPAGAPPAAPVTVGAPDAAATAEQEFGGTARAAVLGPFTSHPTSATHRRAWQVLVEDTVLPGGERGRAWVAVDPASGEVLAARPLLELDAGWNGGARSAQRGMKAQ